MARLAGRTAVVTGGAQGLGKAMALCFAMEGARLVLADINDAAPIAEEIVRLGGQAIALRTDVSDEWQVAEMAARAIERFGTIDILVNNAGIASSFAPRPFEEIDVKEWRRILEVNVIGTFLPCRAVAPVMRANRYGRIVNFSSGTAVRGAPNMLHYVASKGAVAAMTMSLANELGRDNITVNTIAPGYLLTESNLANLEMSATIAKAAVARRAIQRDGFPADLLPTALHLVEQGSGFVSGQLITINGGSA